MSLLEENSKKELAIYDALKNVLDPEVGINIVDLGLVYKIQYLDDEGIYIEMTLSTRACPMGKIIHNDVEETIRSLFPGAPVKVEFVWEPLWSPEFITQEGKNALNHR